MIALGVIRHRSIVKYAKTIEVAYEETKAAHEKLKNTQQQLIHAEKMASLGILTAGVADEINNPTNFAHVGIQNLEVDLARVQQFFVDLAGDDADDEILASFAAQFAPLYDHIKTIANGTERIKTIVEDLRTFTRLDSGSKTTVDITDCIESTLHLVKTKYREVCEFVTDFSPVPKLLCHAPQINLLVNACDAIQDRQNNHEDQYSGQIVIRCGLHHDSVVIEVRDNGCGMSEEHGGTIEVTSTPGMESVIAIYLPVEG